METVPFLDQFAYYVAKEKHLPSSTGDQNLHVLPLPAVLNCKIRLKASIKGSLNKYKCCSFSENPHRLFLPGLKICCKISYQLSVELNEQKKRAKVRVTKRDFPATDKTWLIRQLKIGAPEIDVKRERLRAYLCRVEKRRSSGESRNRVSQRWALVNKIFDNNRVSHFPKALVSKVGLRPKTKEQDG